MGKGSEKWGPCSETPRDYSPKWVKTSHFSFSQIQLSFWASLVIQSCLKRFSLASGALGISFL